jgi:hypothetical protein
VKAKKPSDCPRRHGRPYTAEEEEVMLTAYQRCRESGKSWNAEMDELAVRYERKPQVLEHRFRYMQAARRLAATKN